MADVKMIKLIKERLQVLHRACCRNKTTMSDLNFSVIYVGLLIAAIDGTVSDEELTLLHDFANECGFSLDDDEAKQGLDRAIRNAGYLSLMSRISVYSEDDRLKAFVKAVDAGLPHDFVSSTREDLVFAFTFWTALAMTDGDFSATEKKALEVLKSHFDMSRAIKRNAETLLTRQAFAFSKDYTRIQEYLVGAPEPFLQNEDFTARAEKMLREIGL